MHHVAKHPIAIDSLYLHPVENFLGLALLHICVWAVGPVSLYAYGGLLFVYTQLNIIVHAGLDLPGPLGHIARKHDKHHASMRAGNYASITPLPDLIFGTAD
ncbi:MAG: sterol desaturase family protein [Polyangiaceae bacterium]|nr:sterol desaturase family protein [Polyangiaceae bacterium]